MLISMENVSFGYKDELLFEHVNMTVNEGEKVGFIGGNGEGKTTLLKLLDGTLTPVSGKIFLKNGISIGFLQQTGGFDSDNTVYEEMKGVFLHEQELIENLRDVEKNISKITEQDLDFEILSKKYEFLNKQIDATDAYNYEVKIKTVLNGMGFEGYYDRVIHTMSGGEKTKLKFCKLLLEQPDILILDEPTNHLDVKTLFWLEDYLLSCKSALLVVSHDRYFLDKIVGKIFELENRTVSEFKGNYTKYKQLKAEKISALEKAYEKQQVEIAHMEDYVAKNLVRASTTKMAQSRRNTLEKMDRIEKPYTPPCPPKFTFTYVEKPYELVMQIKNFSLQAGEKKLFDHADATVRRGEKCALVGDNGTGKSTLIKQIVANDRDEISLGKTVKIAYYDQENANLTPTNSVLYELWNRHSLFTQTQIRSALARVGLTAEDMDKPVSALSGGERAKLALAVFEGEKGNFLILDEPTNHLDLAARESLEDALKEFDGTILFVSHDRYFIKAIADKIFEIEDQKLTEFKGSYEQFLNQKKSVTAPPTVTVSKAATSETQEVYKSKQVRADEAKKRARVREIEKLIEQYEQEEDALSQELSSPEVLSDYKLTAEKCKKLEEIKVLYDKLMDEYETLI